MKRTAEEISKELDDQFEALKASCDGFDAGRNWEAKRIANVIYILLYDPIARGNRPPRSQSLLSQAGLKAGMRLISYAEPNPRGNLLSWHPLVSIKMGPQGAAYVPTEKSIRTTKLVSFTTWWDEVVLKLSPQEGGSAVTRKNLIMTMRDQDGGAHYDQRIDDVGYRAFASGAAPGWLYGPADGSPPELLPAAIHLTTIRQIANEVLASVQSTRPSGA